MLTRATFAQRFGRNAVFGMVHLPPLPGAPLYGGSMEAVIDFALRDARAIAGGGCDGVIVENFGDKPFAKNRVCGETIAAMTRVVAEIAREVKLPVGVNVHTGAMLTDQGIIEGEAYETLRRRAVVAPNVAIFADHFVKHAVPLAELDPMQSAKDLRLRGLADALIVTGWETGAAPDAERLRLVREAVDAPLLIGSGLSEANAGTFADADGAIVGTAIKRDGRVDAEVDQERVKRIVAAFKASGR